MSFDNFLPDLIQAQIEAEFAASTVVVSLFKGIPAGAVEKGRSMTIHGAIRPTVQDYAKQGRTYTTEQLKTREVKLTVDQEYVTSQEVDNIDVVQAAGDITPLTDEQGPAHAEAVDTHGVWRLIADGTNSSTSKIDTAARAKAALRKQSAELDDAKVPATGRVALVNGAMKELLVEAIGDSQAMQAAGGNEFRKGQIGEFAGFAIVHTPVFPGPNSEPNAFGDYRTPAVSIAFHEKAAASAVQIAKPGANKVNAFMDEVAYLTVFGDAVTRPEAVRVHGVDVDATEASVAGK